MPGNSTRIQALMDFYAGCEIWLRFYDDMKDYMDKAIVQYAGGLRIDQTPRPTITQALYFNGQDQFVRLGDTSELSFGNRVKMRSLRAWSVWVKFDSFTNNAHALQPSYMCFIKTFIHNL